MHSSRMRTVRSSGHLSCHACPPPTTHAPHHACPPAMHAPPPCMPPGHACPPAMHTHLPQCPPTHAPHMPPTTHTPCHTCPPPCMPPCHAHPCHACPPREQNDRQVLKHYLSATSFADGNEHFHGNLWWIGKESRSCKLIVVQKTQTSGSFNCMNAPPNPIWNAA